METPDNRIDHHLLPPYFASDRLSVADLDAFRSNWRRELSEKSSTEKATKSKHHDTVLAQKVRWAEADVVQQAADQPFTSQEILPSERQSTRQKSAGHSKRTALDVFESAMSKEQQGNLSEALKQYRQAFKVLVGKYYLSKSSNKF